MALGILAVASGQIRQYSPHKKICTVSILLADFALVLSMGSALLPASTLHKGSTVVANIGMVLSRVQLVRAYI